MDTLFRTKKDVKTLSVGLVGLAKSNQSVLGYLKKHYGDASLHLVLRDRAETDGLAWAGVLPKKWTAECKTGAVWESEGNEDIYFRTPVIRSDSELFCRARMRGAMVTSETELFFSLCPCPLYAVTGSDGKTTVSSMTAAILTQCSAIKNTLLGGNIGVPLLDLVDEIAPCDRAVAELSSFQLEDFTPKTKAAAWLNLTENHLDRHRSMEEYEKAKANILLCTKRAVLCADDSIVAKYIKSGDTVWSVKSSGEELKRKYGENTLLFLENDCITTWDGHEKSTLFPTSEMKVRGSHNIGDAMAAAGLVVGDAPYGKIRDGICGFCGVAHRMEYIGVFGNVPCYDSGIDTTPSRTATTLAAMKEKVCVICGGSDKELSYRLLAEALCKYAHTVVLTGATAQKILAAITEYPEFDANKLHVKQCPDFTQAVKEAHKEALENGCALLLSPACASFDVFLNYGKRSEKYISLLNEIDKNYLPD